MAETPDPLDWALDILTDERQLVDGRENWSVDAQYRARAILQPVIRALIRGVEYDVIEAMMDEPAGDALSWAMDAVIEAADNAQAGYEHYRRFEKLMRYLLRNGGGDLLEQVQIINEHLEDRRRAEHAAWEEMAALAMARGCSYCHAGPGERCVTQSGNVSPTLHSAR